MQTFILLPYYAAVIQAKKKEPCETELQAVYIII